MSPVENHFVYLFAWATFGFGHSFLAGSRLSKRCGAYTRLFYNLLALAHIGVVYALGWWLLDTETALSYERFWGWTLYGMGWAILLISLPQYDLGLLSGFKQIRLGLKKPLEEKELRISGIHQFMRHPLYSGVFLILWGGVDTELDLATALWGSIYLLVGTAYEERRLIKQFGEAYLQYRRTVPAYIPWKGFRK